MDSASSDLSVLHLVTTKDTEFFTHQLRSLESMGIDVATVPVPGTHRARRGVETRSFTDYLTFLGLVRRQQLDRFDLIHANYGLTAPAALAQRRLPVVLSLWGSDLLGPFGWLSKVCSTRCAAVIVMSEAMAEALPTPSFVIPHGIDMDRFHPIPKREALDRVGWESDRYHVLFPYPTSRSVKDYPRAERIVSAVRSRIEDDVVLHVTGGRVPHNEMPYFMNAADVLLLTSKREGSPNTVKEALACNLPVVATPVGDVPARLRGVEPSYVGRRDEELVDGVARVLTRGERSNGRDHVRYLSLERTTERLIEIYRSVLDA